MKFCGVILHTQGKTHTSTHLGQHLFDRIHHSLERVCLLRGHLVSTIRLHHIQDASIDQGYLETSGFQGLIYLLLGAAEHSWQMM